MRSLQGALKFVGIEKDKEVVRAGGGRGTYLSFRNAHKILSRLDIKSHMIQNLEEQAQTLGSV